MTIAEIRNRYTRTRESFGFGSSHFEERFETVVEGIRFSALLTNGEQRCVWLIASAAERSFDDWRGPGERWCFVYLTPEEMLELCPSCKEWLERGMAACDSDRFGSKFAVHPDLLAEDAG